MKGKISNMKGKIQIEVKDLIINHLESVSVFAALIFPSQYQYFNWNKQICKDLLSLIYKNKNKYKFIERYIGVLLFCHYQKILNCIANINNTISMLLIIS